MSVENTIACSNYNQGCNGGYPILTAKDGYEFGYVEEDCQPATQSDNNCVKECY